MKVNKTLATVTAADVTASNARLTCGGRIVLGDLNIVAGVPGLGKTQWVVGFCAQASRGRLDGSLAGETVDSLFVSAEDSLEHTLVPRAAAGNADLSALHFFKAINVNTVHGDEEQPGLSIPGDVPIIDDWLACHPRVKVAVFDPIVAMIPVALNTHRDQHVRQALAPLARLAQKHGIAVVLVMHLNKNVEADALSRLSGSIGFGGAARSVLLFAQDPDDLDGENGNRRVLAHVKCNVGPKQESIAYRIEPKTLETPNGPIKTSIVMRDGGAAVSANDLLGRPTSATEASARSEAREFLVSELTDGPVPTMELKTHAEDAGLSWPTVERAKAQLGIRARKRGAGWQWELPQISNTPVDGLDGVDGLGEGKAIKAINSAGREELTVFDPDAELERVTVKLGEAS